MNLLYVGLGAFFLIQFCKTILPWPFQPWTKMFMALLTASVLTAFLGFKDPVANAVLVLAGAGLATLFHRLHRWLGAAGDSAQVSVITAAGRRVNNR